MPKGPGTKTAVAVRRHAGVHQVLAGGVPGSSGLRVICARPFRSPSHRPRSSDPRDGEPHLLDGLLDGRLVHERLLALMSLAQRRAQDLGGQPRHAVAGPEEHLQRGVAEQLVVVGTDGTQAVGIGILRGITDMRIPTLLTLAAYWLIGLPAGYVLAFTLNLGIMGVWYGLLIGLSASALLMMLRFHFHTKAIVK